MMNMEICTISIKEPDISNHPQTGEFFSGLFCYFPEKHCILSLYLIQNRIVIKTAVSAHRDLCGAQTAKRKGIYEELERLSH